MSIEGVRAGLAMYEEMERLRNIEQKSLAFYMTINACADGEATDADYFAALAELAVALEQKV